MIFPIFDEKSRECGLPFRYNRGHILFSIIKSIGVWCSSPSIYMFQLNAYYRYRYQGRQGCCSNTSYWGSVQGQISTCETCMANVNIRMCWYSSGWYVSKEE